MKRLLLLALFVLAIPVYASHIVGGEFEILYKGGTMYEVRMILYFDLLHGNPGAKDGQIVARIFRKSDHAVMMNVNLGLLKTEQVSYTQPACSKGEIKTEKIIYSTFISMESDKFSDPGGYYISWERCCRNYEIDNIYSDPPGNGTFAGQTFYLEFPPVSKDGIPFINSSPRLFPPLNDYACPGKPYYADFAGIDDDGDSLVYELVDPLNTWTGDALPLGGLPRPGNYPTMPNNYPTVTWRDGYSLSKITGGSPDLKISIDGLLTVTPRTPEPDAGGDDPGDLLVFAVRCSEFRDGVKIGEVRRDFQMLVLNSCPVADPPQILGKKSGETNFAFDENMAVSFDQTVVDGQRCIQLRVSDPDSEKSSTTPKDNKKESIGIRLVALNFKKDLNSIFPPQTAVIENGGYKDFEICLDKCPYIIGSPYQIGIIAYDDACALPLLDTLKVLVDIEPPDNEAPYFTTPNVQQVINEGDVVQYPIYGVDPDGNPLTVAITNDGFALGAVGMTIKNSPTPNSEYSAVLEWDTKCDMYDFTKKTSFELKFTIEDQDECNVPLTDLQTFKLQVILPGNADPIISTDLTPEEVANGIERKVFEALDFNVFGNDSDGDKLVLTTKGLGYNMATYSMSSPETTANGHVQTHFDWDIVCNQLNLSAKDVFDVQFIVVDNANKCRFYKADTLNVKIKVAPPDNEKPILSVVNNNPQLTLVNNEQSLLLGQQISLGLISNDPFVAPKTDHVKIELIDAQGNVAPQGYAFAEAEGDGSASTTFVWNPDCSIFENKVYENNYTFRFRTVDDRCFNILADTVEVKLNIKDIDGSDADFIPPNVITANGDGCNDFFAMEGFDDVTGCNGDPEIILPQLPKDNCAGQFVEILIYNRWGTEVYRSNHRNFRWYPTNQAAGVYFYTLKFSNKDYKGIIHLRL
jgi:hypothetical protein